MNKTSFAIEIYSHMIACFIVSYLGFFMGSFGNLWYFIIISKSSKLRSKVSYQILLIIIATDWFLNTIIFSMRIFMNYSAIISNLPLQSPKLCLWVGSIYAVLYASSNLAQMYLTLYRGLAIFVPLFFRKITSSHAIKILLGCFFFSYVTSILISYGGIGWFVQYYADNQWGECADQGTLLPYRILRRLIFIYIPIFGSLATYFGIMIKIILYRYKNKRKNLPNVNQTQLYSTISLFARMLFCSVAVAPFWFDTSTSRTNMSDFVTLWVKFLFQFSYSVNPVRISKFISHDFEF